MRHQRFFTLASGDRIVRPPDVIECASNERTTKEANTATRVAEALGTTASLRGYFDDLLSAPRPKRTVKMERVVNSIKNCQMVLTRIGETTPSFSEIRSRRALPSVGDLIVFLVAGELVHVRVEQILAPPQREGTFVVSLKEGCGRRTLALKGPDSN
jgi:hypothetical protein